MSDRWFKSHWKQIKNDVPQRWRLLSVLDLELIQGKKENLIDAVCRRYGYSQQKARRVVDEWDERLCEQHHGGGVPGWRDEVTQTGRLGKEPA